MYNNLTAEQAAQRALDYAEIQNVWSGHAYCYRAQKQRYELDRFWAKEHDDIMYAHESTAYVGRERVYRYYADSNEMMNVEKLKLMHELFPDEVEDKPENLGIGELVIRCLTSPYIEIARDGMTAKGIWTVVGISSEIDRQGKPVPFLQVGKEAVDFVRESDGWKIWHFRTASDFDYLLPSEVLTTNPFQGLASRTVLGTFPESNRKIYSFAQEGYSPKEAATFSPPLPEPYDTWDDSMSYARPADEN
jgi:hypothetical protein